MGNALAEKTLSRLLELAAITDEPGQVCRTFLSPAMKRANEFVGGWMSAAGGKVSIDGWGNLIGHFPGTSPKAKTLLLGSHLDTVPNAGKYDGPLGVLVALAAIESLAGRGVRLPFHVDVIGFGDEEGTRFHSAYLGSEALTGTIKPEELDLRDKKAISVREAVAAFQGVAKIPLPKPRYAPKNLLGYVEVHIEQGPVLEKLGQPLGVVDAIAAQTRLVYTIRGKASHAGTTPMMMRFDALAAGAKLILDIEQIGRRTPGLVATVGQIKIYPDASNVIPSFAQLSVDIRHPKRRVVAKACRRVAAAAHQIEIRRGLEVTHKVLQSTPDVSCAWRLIRRLEKAVAVSQKKVPHLVSGAGHDGIVLSRITPMAMLFVRCRDGLSHHPDEHVELADIDAAVTALTRFLEDFK